MKKQSTHKSKIERAMKLKKEKARRPILIPVHISGEEVFYFNYLQGGQSVDPSTGLREYSKLSELIKVPEIRDIFIKVSSIAFSGEEEPRDVAEFVNENDPAKYGMEIEPIDSDFEPEVQELSSHGENGDDYLVMMPDDVVLFLDILQGGASRAPEDHLQEFFNFGKAFRNITRGVPTTGISFVDKPIQRIHNSNAMRSVTRTVATVAGGIVGGIAGAWVGMPTVGAGIGAGIGNMAGRYVTGQNPGKDMYQAGMKNVAYGMAGKLALGAAGVGAGAGAAGAGTAGTAGAAGAAGSGVGAAGSAGAVGAGAGTAGAAGAGAAGAGTAGSGLLGGLSGYALPGALLAGSMLLGNKGQKQKEKEYEDDKRDHRGMMEEQNNYIHRPLRGSLYAQPEYVFDQSRGRERDSGYEDDLSYRSPRRSAGRAQNAYKKGGLVSDYSVRGIALKGPGKGQADLIKKNIPEYTWIHDATTVSNLGDGVTDEGHKEIHAFENKIRKEMLPLYKDRLKSETKSARLRKVPCAVANGEHEMPPLLVGALGEGSFEKGATILRKMTKEIRRHKTSSRDGLPPAAHDLDTYYKKIISKRK